MPKAYWIVRVDISNATQYQQYIAANAEPLALYPARLRLVKPNRTQAETEKYQ